MQKWGRVGGRGCCCCSGGGVVPSTSGPLFPLPHGVALAMWALGGISLGQRHPSSSLASPKTWRFLSFPLSWFMSPFSTNDMYIGTHNSLKNLRLLHPYVGLGWWSTAPSHPLYCQGAKQSRAATLGRGRGITDGIVQPRERSPLFLI